MKQIIILVACIYSFQLGLAQNPIVIENQQAGNPISEWGVPDFRDNRIAGFSTNMSVNSGQTVHFKIDVQGGADYTIKIYRIGYYSGDGARIVADLGTFSGDSQPQGISDPVTGMLDCDNWSESASWNIPASAVSGLYIAKLVRTGGGSNHIAFIVRNDASSSDIYFQIPDVTWQAYNGYGGNSCYDGNTGYPNGHAVKVSYNRPIFPYNSLFNTDGRQADWYMNSEYPMIRWLERNGYDVTYTGGNDVHNNGNRLLNHKILLFAGHDEYWSKEQRNNVEAARAAGIHLAFFTGNEVYWKVRWENNNGNEDRTLVCYKEGKLGTGFLGERTCGSKCDASSPEWTGLWRTGDNYDAGRPENELLGQISWTEAVEDAIKVPAFYRRMRFWRNTTVTSMATGETTSLGGRTLGYEWDYEQDAYKNTNPQGRITLSSTTINGKTHKLSLYKYASGALVFGAGTIQWSWGLDGQHYGVFHEINKNMQQATVNLFADMGVQPGTLQNNLIEGTPSTDFIAPGSTITAPSTGSSFPVRSPITINGTAADGELVAGVEVSVDGGATWQPATITTDLDGNVSWSFTWTPEYQGTFNVKARAFDDSGNMENAGTGITLNILPPECPCTIFDNTDLPEKLDQDSPLELGVTFRVNSSGFITGIRFYKDIDNIGTHVGTLWNQAGEALAQVTFTNETEEGWQQAEFSTPVAVTEGTTYVASYYNPSGLYSVTPNFFTSEYPAGPASTWPLQARKDESPTIGNGVYAYGGSSTFPTHSFSKANYFIDVVYIHSLAAPASLNGSVTLQGRPAAPHASWQVPLTVDLYIAPDMSTPAFSYSVTTDADGAFTINNIPTGVYTIAVKNSHTLKRVKQAQTISSGTNNVDFGTLLEGDCAEDNIVNVFDLSLLATSFGKSIGETGFDPRVDFNHDGTVNIFDLSLLANNYSKTGENP